MDQEEDQRARAEEADCEDEALGGAEIAEEAACARTSSCAVGPAGSKEAAQIWSSPAAASLIRDQGGGGGADQGGGDEAEAAREEARIWSRRRRRGSLLRPSGPSESSQQKPSAVE